MVEAHQIARRITLRQLRAMAALSQYGSFTQAADALSMSQPAFSTLIAKLEKELGVRCVERTTRTLSITDAGAELVGSARRILEDVDEAVRNARGHGALRRGRLAIAALPSICMGTLPGVIRRFREHYPDIEVSIADLIGDDLIRSAMTERVDFALGFVANDDGRAFETIFTDRLVAIGSPSLLQGVGPSIAWRELAGIPIIAMAHGSSVRRLIDSGAAKSGVDLELALEPVQIPTALAYAVSGLGVALLPSSIAGEIGERDLIIRTIVDPEIERAISIIRPHGRALGPPAAKLLDMLRELRRDD